MEILMRNMSTMTLQEMHSMQNSVIQAAIAHCQKNKFTGLSHAGWFNFYSALQDAIESEWVRAKEKTAEGV
jgi:hypothetical protein